MLFRTAVLSLLLFIAVDALAAEPHHPPTFADFQRAGFIGISPDTTTNLESFMDNQVAVLRAASLTEKEMRRKL